MKTAIGDALQNLPDAYSNEAFDRAVDTLFHHVFESHAGKGKSRCT